MKIIIDGIEYRFSWKHKLTGSKRYTRCFVRRNEEVVGSVRSHVDSRDPYIKNKGRIRSLTKALLKLKEQFPESFNRENRRNVWIAYTQMSPQTWQING